MLSFSPRALATALLTLSLLAAPAEAGNRIYVPSATSLASTVAVVDPAANAVIATVTVGTTPRGVAISPDRTLVYVTNMHSNDVSVISTATNTVIATIPVGTGPLGVAVSPDSLRVYVTNQTSNTVSVIDVSSLAVIATVPIPGGSPSTGGAMPQGLVVDPAGARVYVANWLARSVSVIDTNLMSVIGTVSLASPILHAQPIALTVNSAGTRLYVGGWSPLFVIDTATLGILSVLSLSRTESLSLSPDDSKLYMANRLDGTVTVLNTASNTVVATVPATSPFSGSLNATGTRYYLTTGGTSVQVLDTATLTLSTTSALVPFGSSAFGNSYVHSDACLGLTVTPASLHFPRSGGTQAFQVSAPAGCKWFLTIPVGWLSASPTGSVGSATVHLTAQPNSRASRGATISVTGVGVGSSSTSLMVGQS